MLQHRRGGQYPANTSPTTTVQVLTHILQANQEPAASIIAGLGVVLQDPTVLVGLTCTPVTVIGVGGVGTCDVNAVCCQDNSYVSTASSWPARVTACSPFCLHAGRRRLHRLCPRHPLIAQAHTSSTRTVGWVVSDNITDVAARFVTTGQGFRMFCILCFGYRVSFVSEWSNIPVYSPLRDSTHSVRS